MIRRHVSCYIHRLIFNNIFVGFMFDLLATKTNIREKYTKVHNRKTFQRKTNQLKTFCIEVTKKHKIMLFFTNVLLRAFVNY